MLSGIKYGMESAIAQKKIILFIYLLQFVIALPIGMQVLQVIESSIGNSMSMDIIQEGFNRTVFEDFLNVHGASITPLIGTLRYIIPLYLIVSVFLHAGIFGNIIRSERNLTSFFVHGIKYFPSFLAINLVILSFIIIWSLALFVPYLIIIGNPMEDLHSEKVFLFSLAAIAIPYLAIVLLVWTWGVNSRYLKVSTDASITRCLKLGWNLLRSVFKSQAGIFITYAVIHGLTIFLYFLITDPIGASSIWLILLVIILQQAFALFRIALRVALFGGLIDIARSTYATMI